VYLSEDPDERAGALLPEDFAGFEGAVVTPVPRLGEVLAGREYPLGLLDFAGCEYSLRGADVPCVPLF
jgi:hypothetical protein